MRHSSSSDEFNGPSREILYKRIHQEAFGADWVYDWNSFIEWDRKNIRKPSSVPAIKRESMQKQNDSHHKSCVRILVD